MTDGQKIVTRNRKAFHDYHIEETFQAGIVLQGSEIKSIRNNNIQLRDGFVQERENELWLMGVHISPYEQSGVFGHSDPVRPRKLLLQKREIAKIVDRLLCKRLHCRSYEGVSHSWTSKSRDWPGKR